MDTAALLLGSPAHALVPARGHWHHRQWVPAGCIPHSYFRQCGVSAAVESTGKTAGDCAAVSGLTGWGAGLAGATGWPSSACSIARSCSSAIRERASYTLVGRAGAVGDLQTGTNSESSPFRDGVAALLAHLDPSQPHYASMAANTTGEGKIHADLAAQCVVYIAEGFTCCCHQLTEMARPRAGGVRARFLWRPNVWDANISATYSEWFHDMQPLPTLLVQSAGMWNLKRNLPSAMDDLESEIDALAKQWSALPFDLRRHAYWIPAGTVDYSQLHHARLPLTPARLHEWDAIVRRRLEPLAVQHPGIHYAAAVEDIYAGSLAARAIFVWSHKGLTLIYRGPATRGALQRRPSF